jgi:Flp pilus assembly pilin Flp
MARFGETMHKAVGRVCLLLRKDDGQTIVEYALILAVVAAGAVGVLSVLSSEVSGLIMRVADAFPGG